MKKLLIILYALMFALPASARYQSGYYKPSTGKYVAGHFKTKSDGYKFNNYSTRGNYNPYTRSKGYKSPSQTYKSKTYKPKKI